MALRVLVADDSVTVFHQLKGILEAEPGEFEIIGHASTGEEAVKKYGELGPDIVTMDIVMPGMGGVDAVKQILASDPQARIVVVSSLGGVKDKVVEVLSAGAKNVIVKPFEADKVLKVLRGL